MLFDKQHGLAAFLLIAMAGLMIGSSLGDSTTTDEQAHIPAGYAYVKFLDYRLNPEHPPLVKALAGIPLLFLNLNYPVAASSWTADVNGQWTQGTQFIYESGNDPATILFFARLPMILLTLSLGALFYLFAKKRFGGRAALLALFFFAVSPTFLAHGRLVTTDIGATLAFFIGLISYVQFLEAPTRKNLMLAGLALGIAELLKFSAVLLFPIYPILLIVWAAAQNDLLIKERLKLALRLIGKTILVGLIGLAVIWAAYALFTWNYPAEKQLSDSAAILKSFPARPLADAQLSLAKIPFTRPIAHYLLGVFMALQRSGGGNTFYFLGEVANEGSPLYFPLTYLTKEPLAFHFLTLMALAFALYKIRKGAWGWTPIISWIRHNFMVFAALFFVAFYWIYTIRSPLNIGARHVLPTFPFIYLLVSREIVQWLRRAKTLSPRMTNLPIPALPAFILALAVLWMGANTVFTYPYFISSYNELAGGPMNGYKIATDSNYDWGQDMLRLTQYVKEKGIAKISVDYFGGSKPGYYLGDKYAPWGSARGAPKGWFAISATLREGGMNPTKDFSRKPEDSYQWLAGQAPIARAGYSIFIYKFPD